MAKNNAICSVCGKPYRVCRTCKEQGLASWKTVTDTEECFKVFTVLHRYNVLKNIEKEDAKDILTSLNIQHENYPTNIKNSIDNILAEPKTVVKEKVEEIKVESVTEEKEVKTTTAPTKPQKQTRKNIKK